LIQQKLNPTQRKAKLVKVEDVEWKQEFEDEEKRKWEMKINSEYTRAEVY